MRARDFEFLIPLPSDAYLTFCFLTDFLKVF